MPSLPLLADPLGSVAYFSPSSCVLAHASSSRSPRTPSAAHVQDSSWAKEEVQGVILFLGICFTPSKSSNSFGTWGGTLLPHSSTIRLCGVRVNWDVAKKLERCVKSRGALIRLSLEDEEEELFGASIDFTNALLDWWSSSRKGDDAEGGLGSGDSCLLLVPEDCVSSTPLPKKPRQPKTPATKPKPEVSSNDDVPMVVEVSEGGGRENLANEGWSVHKVKARRTKTVGTPRSLLEVASVVSSISSVASASNTNTGDARYRSMRTFVQSRAGERSLLRTPMTPGEKRELVESRRREKAKARRAVNAFFEKGKTAALGREAVEKFKESVRVRKGLEMERDGERGVEARTPPSMAKSRSMAAAVMRRSATKSKSTTKSRKAKANLSVDVSFNVRRGGGEETVTVVEEKKDPEVLDAEGDDSDNLLSVEDYFKSMLVQIHAARR
ncbi:hypothetical protein TrVE_jg4422 [Triparma verrucosa]|uniref:Uncharacterized protein n=1 Tax=Triparma verrucosa TaxID=1606542 RepID=A0A9W7BH43_9STRA|nr:hypothetical protein TrVE_jg4422 [Triparma verrucosa]